MKRLFTNRGVAFIGLYFLGIFGLVLLHKALSILFISIIWSVDLVVNSVF